MKKLIPWLCLAATSTFATEGLDAYRQGLYSIAAKTFNKESNKDPVIDYYLGRMWLYGYGELKNNPLALSWFVKAGQKGYLPAQQFLAEYYLIEEKSPESALAWFKKAAMSQDVKAQLYCAAAYLYGLGTSKNSDAAKRYLIDAAKSGDSVGQYSLGVQFLESRDSQTKKMGIIWLTKAANQGNPVAQRKLGELYLNGTSVNRDLEKGQALLLSAAQKKDSEALLILARKAEKEQNFQQAQQWIQQAVAVNPLAASVAQAALLMNEKNPQHNNKEAFYLLLKAAQSGSIDAQKNLALLYKGGKGLVANENLAKQWDDLAKKAIDHLTAENRAALWLSNNQYKTFRDAGYQLTGILKDWSNKTALKQANYNASPQTVTIYRNEIYKPEFVMSKPSDIPISDYFAVLAPLLNPGQESKWFFPRYPVDKRINSVIRQESLVLRHEQGSILIDDEANYLTNSDEEHEEISLNYLDQKTREFAHQANMQAVLSDLYEEALLGMPSAQFEIGQLYQYGIGVEQNIEQAIIYYQLAAIQQDIRAEYNLGILYLEGKTNPVNYEQGVQWMTSAAFKGNAYAQYVLANLYEYGLQDNNGKDVVAINHSQALAMYFLSSANHFGEAEYKLADLLVRDPSQDKSTAAVAERSKLIKRLYAGAARRGVAEAILPLAFYNAMESNPEKQARALKVARKEAREGNPQAALLLAIMIDRGIGTESNPVEAIDWYKKASANPVSDFILGTFYAEGPFLKVNTIKARELLQASAEAGFSYGRLNLAILKQQSRELFIPDLDKAREEGNSKAGILLADYYLSEANSPENMAKARTIYQTFAEKGEKEAELKLGFLFDRGLGGEANRDKAAFWYNKAAVQGQPVAQFLLAKLYQMGHVGQAPDYALAKSWYQKAESSYPKAALALGFVEETVNDNYQEALQNYLKNAADPVAAYNIGLIYEYGKGVPFNLKEARVWFERASNQGHREAMTQLASLDFQDKNLAEAVQWYTRASNLNDPQAKYQLGLFYETGVGTSLDPAKAFTYYQESSGLGDEKAKFAMARMLQYGIGIEPNLEKAIELYQELANNYNVNAQYQLAMLYVKNKENLARGKELLQKAGENGHQEAQKTLRLLNAREVPRISFIASANLNQAPGAEGAPAEMMYFDAMNAWNRGDESLSRHILSHILSQYPDYTPAKQTANQMNHVPGLMP